MRIIMNKKTILSVLLVLLVLSLGALLVNKIVTGQDDTPDTKERLLQTITEDTPAYSHNNTPVIEIDSVITFEDKWHIVTIKSLRSKGAAVPVKVIMLDVGNKSMIIAGPDTHFAEPELLKKNVPDSVILELRKS